MIFPIQGQKKNNIQIQFTQGYVLKIGDFGAMKKAQKDEFTDNEFLQRATYIGTPQYIPPEITGTIRIYNEKADIWALGLVFYEMATLLDLPHAAYISKFCSTYF